ncbi:unnamed protein product [Clonostachys rosea]|uniref:Uncharacterized protein n=1 Tax=Bionectria ochroleuca TaxID=29856 RepID=A0ABY6V3B2_BIOOC|nr:unnamed protein product [Clonostachys rosea]
MDSKQHHSPSGDSDKISSKNGNGCLSAARSSQPHRQPQRTFKLFEFNRAFGCDAHHFIFIQRESNLEALAAFEDNLGDNIGKGRGTVRPFSRLFTETDLKNIQSSCLEILAGFSGTSDHVTYQAILGEIEVKRCDDREGHIWFDDTFTDKDPHWSTGFNIGSSQVIDLEIDTFV